MTLARWQIPGECAVDVSVGLWDSDGGAGGINQSSNIATWEVEDIGKGAGILVVTGGATGKDSLGWTDDVEMPIRA